jgi:RNA polymerase sigma-70 factor (ECF subfamily)
MLDDATLVDRAIREWQAGVGCDENFRRLFEHYYRPIHRFFSRRGVSSDLSRDLTQETFVRVFQGIGEFRREAPFEVWLFQIAANVHRNSLRSAATQKRAGRLVCSDIVRDPFGESDLTPRSTDVAALDRVLQEERHRLLRDAVAALPTQMRRCLILRVYQDRTYEEIAFVLRLSVQTVKAHLFQARRQLRTRLAGVLRSEFVSRGEAKRER